MVKDIFDTILEKEYHQLNSKELSELAEYCHNEKEFLSLKEVISKTKAVYAGPKLTSRATSKENLDQLFDKTYGNTKKGFLFYRNPLFQVAAAVLFIIVTWAFYNYSSSLPEKQQLAENTNSETKKTTNEDKKEEVKLVTQEEVVNDGIKESKNDSVEEDETKIQTQTRTSKAEQAPSPAIARQGEGNTFTSKAEVAGKANTNELNYESLALSETAIEKRTEQQKKTYQSYSAPATSAKDIQVDASKRNKQKTVLTSMNSSSQNNVLKFLVVKY